MDARSCAIAAAAVTGGIHGVRDTFFTRYEPLVTFVTQFIILYTAGWLYRTFIYPFYRSPLRSLPGPKDDHFILGQTVKQFAAPSPHQLYCEWSRRWPDAAFIRHMGFANSETLLANSLQAHKEILQTYCYSFVKPSYISRLICEIAGTGVFAAEGAEHKKQRRLLAGPFSLSNLKKIQPVFKEKAVNLAVVIESHLEDGKSNGMEMQSILHKATLDVIGTTVLGVELNSLDSNSSTMGFHEYYDRMLNQEGLSGLITFINVIVPIRKLVPIEANLGFVRASQAVRRMIKAVIADRIKSLSNVQRAAVGDDKPKESAGRDILTYMIEERHSGEDAWSEDDILGHLMNFMSAGHDTSATGLTWAVYVMARQPSVQEKLRAEVMGVLQHNSNPDYSTIESMHYLHNFLRELLRLYSPTVAAHREPVTDITIDGVRIPKGTPVVLSMAVTNLSPVIWGPTVDEFIPERWDELQGDTASPYAFETFINGPRVCIGKQFAILEMKIMLIELVSRFRFTPSDKQDLEDIELLNPGLTYRPKHGLFVKVDHL